MHIEKLQVSGLRGIEELEVPLHKGLNVLIGENNTGKSSLMTALRLVLSASTEIERPYLTDDDFHVGPHGRHSEIRVICTFGGLSTADQGRLLEALVATSEPPVAIVATSAIRTDKGKVRVRHWCGTSEESALPAALIDWLGLAFLPPLRDPTRGLQPGRNSQFARLLRELTSDAEVAELEAAAASANVDLSAQPPVSRTSDAVNRALREVTGPELSQIASLGFTASDFNRLLHGLTASIDGLSIGQNGLGYNNLVYTATVLAALRRDTDLAFSLFLVEEPEAHLHPQLQALLYRHLAQTAHGDDATQIIVSTHSTHIASAVDPRSCIVLSSGVAASAVPLARVPLLARSWAKLGRYLDATRSSLLFARRVLLVEGISEAILLAEIARAADYDLRDYSVSIVSTEGLNFAEFIELLGPDGLARTCAVVTDADGKLHGDRYYPGRGGQKVLSAAAKATVRTARSPVAVFVAQSTLEYDIVLYSNENLQIGLDALRPLHPRLHTKLESRLAGLPSLDAKAAEFHDFLFEQRDVSKAEFSESVASLLQERPEFVVPPYLLAAILHVTSPQE